MSAVVQCMDIYCQRDTAGNCPKCANGLNQRLDLVHTSPAEVELQPPGYIRAAKEAYDWLRTLPVDETNRAHIDAIALAMHRDGAAIRAAISRRDNNNSHGPANLEGLRDKLLDPMLIRRTSDGMVDHAALPITDEDVHFGKLLSAFGLETAFVPMENDAPALYEQHYERGDTSAFGEWQPTPPAGDDWLLISTYDTEDGPYAMFVRKARTERQRKMEDRERMIDAACQPSQEPRQYTGDTISGIGP